MRRFSGFRLSPAARQHAEKLYRWYLAHPDEFLPTGVTMNKKQYQVLVFNVSLLSAWAYDNNLPEVTSIDLTSLPRGLN